MSSEIPKRIWQTIVLLSFFFIVAYIPLEILYPRFDNIFFRVTYWIVNSIFIADAFYNYTKKEKIESVELSTKYKTAFLIVDIISAIPFGFITGSIFFELFRFIKIIRVINYIRNINLEEVKLSSYLSFVFFLYWFLIAVHLLACGWISLNDARANIAEEYLTSLYWCMQTITTVGYGDVTPPSALHKIYSMLVMLFGVGVYGFVIGNVANILLKRDPAKTQFLNNLERLRLFVNFREIPSNLQKRIRNYYEYIWKQKIGANETEFVSSLPDGLKTEVELFLKRDVLERIPLFKGINDSFLREVSLHLRPVVYTPGDYIFKAGDRGNEMYFLISGKMKVLTGDEKKVLNNLSDGDFFGELALFQNEIRLATVQAVTYCDIYILNKEVFEHVLNNYPEISSHIRKIAAERLKNS
ncbi:MAG TPA: cyclic nucleotide-binding domain-containing protein [Ignavibacteriaceae bacterium]|nr:cyclic nucleotide-binding domain-containing protein [Ignavibacteriaceae bacterium]